MKLVSSDLEILIETWSDPGDYPNALAQGPLPSYDYFAGVEGCVVVELGNITPDTLILTKAVSSVDHSWIEEFVPELHDLLEKVIPSTAMVYSWSTSFEDGKLELEVSECEEAT